MIAAREVVARFWPAPVLLLIGLIAAESAFEDREGSGNIADIQHHAQHSPPRLARAPASPDSFAGDEDEPAWFSKDGPDNAAAIGQPEIAQTIEPHDLLDRGGGRIPMPEQELVERASSSI
ncbi:MAG: hypothetical protein KDE32_02230 [Novosphingobium sp.]|nr:hypothetical protein [Novosphingobium sp.]